MSDDSRDEIQKLVTRYCDNFIRTGELDQAMLAKLHAYVEHKTGRPVQNTSARRRGKGSGRPGVPRKLVLIPGTLPRKQGRQKGTKIWTGPDGKRRLVSAEDYRRLVNAQAPTADHPSDTPALV
jgi:hypothetical protein